MAIRLRHSSYIAAAGLEEMGILAGQLKPTIEKSSIPVITSATTSCSER